MSTETHEKLQLVMDSMAEVHLALENIPSLDTFLTGSWESDEEFAELEKRVHAMYEEASSISGRVSVLLDTEEESA